MQGTDSDRSFCSFELSFYALLSFIAIFHVFSDAYEQQGPNEQFRKQRHWHSHLSEFVNKWKSRKGWIYLNLNSFMMWHIVDL